MSENLLIDSFERISMTEHEGNMWNIIGALGWVESGYDFRGIEHLLLTNYNDGDIISLIEFVDERENELMDRIEQYETDNGIRCGDYNGDNSWSHMLAHVVGMGKVTYDTIMNNPTRLEEIGIVDSFSYAIPYPYQLVQAREELTAFN